MESANINIEKNINELTSIVLKFSQSMENFGNALNVLLETVKSLESRVSAIEEQISAINKDFVKKITPAIFANQEMITNLADGFKRISDNIGASMNDIGQFVNSFNASFNEKVIRPLSDIVGEQKNITQMIAEINQNISGGAIDKLISIITEISAQIQNAMHMITINQLISRIDEVSKRILSPQPIIIPEVVATATTAAAQSAPTQQVSASPQKTATAVASEKKEEEKKEEGIESTRLLKPSMLFGKG
ncbi:MAG: hypothetical protein QXL15_03065 [Candidatus Korarchaeota archaeon]